MYASPFSYHITRPYPYRWFTWLVIIGGTILTVLFSVINLAATGYESSIVFKTNPNATEHPDNPAWFQKRPWSLVTKVSSTCQSQTIVKGSRIYTTNLGFPYKIAGLYSGSQQNPIVSFAYHNSPLSCTFISLMLSPILGNFVALDASASINCTVYDTDVPITMILDLDLHFDTTSQIQSNDSDIFVKLDNFAQPSLFWGQRMLKYSYEILSTSYINQRNSVKPLQSIWLFYSGTLNNASLQENTSGPETNFVTSSLTFQAIVNNQSSSSLMCSGCQYSTLTEEEWTSASGSDFLSQKWLSCGVIESKSYKSCNDPAAPFLKQGVPAEGVDCGMAEAQVYTPCDIRAMPYVRQGIAMEGLASLTVSTVLTDLGQVGKRNILSSPQQTRYTIDRVFRFLNDTRQTSKSFQGDYVGISDNIQFWSDWKPPIEPNEFFNWLKTGVPHVNSTGIATQYLCQVPKLKSTGALLVSVIVADLVLLQAFWVVLNWIVSLYLERRHPDAKHCSGCMGACTGVAADEVETQPTETLRKPTRIHSTRSVLKPKYQLSEVSLGPRVSLYSDQPTVVEDDAHSISDMEADDEDVAESTHRSARGSSQPLLLLSPQP